MIKEFTKQIVLNMLDEHKICGFHNNFRCILISHIASAPDVLDLEFKFLQIQTPPHYSLICFVVQFKKKSQ